MVHKYFSGKAKSQTDLTVFGVCGKVTNPDLGAQCGQVEESACSFLGKCTTLSVGSLSTSPLVYSLVAMLRSLVDILVCKELIQY